MRDEKKNRAMRVEKKKTFSTFDFSSTLREAEQ
jgi:hypothetical protein